LTLRVGLTTVQPYTALPVMFMLCTTQQMLTLLYFQRAEAALMNSGRFVRRKVSKEHLTPLH